MDLELVDQECELRGLESEGGQEKHSYITDINAVSAKLEEASSVASIVKLLPKHDILI
jgi:hypothetical protein